MADRFLTDIALPRDPGGSLRTTPTGDLMLSSGRDNVAQALERRVLVGQGTLLHRPDYGAGLKLAIERSVPARGAGRIPLDQPIVLRFNQRVDAAAVLEALKLKSMEVKNAASIEQQQKELK